MTRQSKLRVERKVSEIIESKALVLQSLKHLSLVWFPKKTYAQTLKHSERLLLSTELEVIYESENVLSKRRVVYVCVIFTK